MAVLNYQNSVAPSDSTSFNDSSYNQGQASKALFNDKANQLALSQATAEQQATQNQANLLGTQNQKATDVNSLLFGNSKDPTGQFSKILQLLGIGGGAGGSNGSISGSGGGGASPADYSGLMGQVNALLGQVGQSRTNDINRSVNDSVNSSLAHLDDRGFGSSSLSANTVQGGERVRQDSLGQLSDELLGQRSSALQNIGLAGLNAQNQNYQFNAQLSNQRSQQGLGFLSQLLG